MAEAIGIAFSAAAILGFTEATTSLICALKEVYQDKDGALLRDIYNSVNSLETTSNVIEAAIQILEEEMAKHHRSAAVKKLRKKKCIQGIQHQIGVLAGKFEATAEQIRRLRFAKRFQWAIGMRQKVNDMMPRTGAVENLLILAYLTVQVERLSSVACTCNGEIAEELKRIVRQKRDSAERRKQVLQQIQEHGLVRDDDDPEDYKEIRRLQRITKQMQTILNDMETKLDRQSRVQAEQSVRNEPLEISQPLPTPPDSPVAEESMKSPLPDSPTTNEPTEDSLPASPALSMISSRSLSQRWAALGKPLSPAVQEGQEVKPIEVNKEGNSTDCSRPREIRLSVGTDRPILAGVIRYGDSLKDAEPIIARVDKNLSENIISLSAANELKFQIEEKTDFGRVVFEDQSSSSTNVVGTAEVNWWPSGDLSQERKKIKVYFWVCEFLHDKLIFGRPFLDAKERQSRYNNGSR